MLKEFKAFLLRGNLVQIAVAFVMGIAFAAVVTSFVTDIITPIIAAIFGQPDFGALKIDIGTSAITYGTFLNAVFSFVVIAFVLFLVVKVYNRMAGVKDPTTKNCPFCTTAIPVAATRCPACTSELESA